MTDIIPIVSSPLDCASDGYRLSALNGFDSDAVGADSFLMPSIHFVICVAILSIEHFEESSSVK